MTINDTGAIIFGHGITRVLICVDFAARSAGSHKIVIRKTLELNRAFFISQDGINLIDCFFEKVTARENKQVTFCPARSSVLNQFSASQTLNKNPSQ